MKLFSGSIFCFFMLTSFCNASDQKPPLWSFPVLTKIKKSITSNTHQSQPTLPKNPSDEWTTIDIHEVSNSDRKKTPSPDIVIVQSIEESKSQEHAPKTSSLQANHNQLSSKPLATLPKLPSGLQTDIMINRSLGNMRNCKLQAKTEDVMTSPKPQTMIHSYQNPILTATRTPMSIDQKEQTDKLEQKAETYSLYKLIPQCCLSCLSHIYEEKEEIKKKSNSRLDTKTVMNAINNGNYQEALDHIDNMCIHDESF